MDQDQNLSEFTEPNYKENTVEFMWAKGRKVWIATFIPEGDEPAIVEDGDTKATALRKIADKMEE